MSILVRLLPVQLPKVARMALLAALLGAGVTACSRPNGQATVSTPRSSPAPTSAGATTPLTPAERAANDATIRRAEAIATRGPHQLTAATGFDNDGLHLSTSGVQGVILRSGSVEMLDTNGYPTTDESSAFSFIIENSIDAGPLTVKAGVTAETHVVWDTQGNALLLIIYPNATGTTIDMAQGTFTSAAGQNVGTSGDRMVTQVQWNEIMAKSLERYQQNFQGGSVIGTGVNILLYLYQTATDRSSLAENLLTALTDPGKQLPYVRAGVPVVPISKLSNLQVSLGSVVSIAPGRTEQGMQVAMGIWNVSSDEPLFS